MMNNVTLIGRLVRDPEVRYTQGGLAIANMTLAVDKGLAKAKKEEFEKANKPTADFIRLVAFDKLAETCSNHLAKGRLVGITGRIQTGSYDAEDGTKRYTTDVIVNQLDILEWEDKATDGGTSAPASGGTNVPDGFVPINDLGDDDDIPF